MADADWTPPPLGELIDLADAAALAARRTAKPRARLLKAGTDPVLALVDESLDTRSEAALALLEGLGDRAEQVAEGLREPVVRIVGTAYDEGWSVKRTAAAIVESADAVAEWQAAALARTDLVTLENGGSLAAVRRVNAVSAASGESGFTHKRWLSAADGRVRPDHATAHGQTVPIDEAFTVGGAAMQYPGDPAGPPAEVWNCRCTLTYLEGADAVAASVPPLPPVTLEGEMAEPNAALLEMAETLKDLAEAGLSREQIDAAVEGVADLVAAAVEILAEEELTSNTSTNSTAAVTIRVEADEEAAITEPAAGRGARWESELAFENWATEDGRFMMPDSLSWREPPLTLMAMVETTEGGHLGAQVAGRMDTFEKRPSDLGADVVAVFGTGVFDDEDYGAMIERMVEDQMLSGISVDLAISEWAARIPETGETIAPEDLTDDQWWGLMLGDLQFAVLEATILAATVCPTPAFAEAKISMTASGEKRMTLWAPLRLVRSESPALVASAAPLAPPRAWFERPEADELTPITITEEGEVFGHVATYDCHRGFQGHCVTVPGTGTRSNFADYHLGQLLTAEGDTINIGKITIGRGHADGQLSKAAAREHYDDVDCVAAFGRCYVGKLGTWFSGALKSDITPERLRDFRANPPSGDWRGGELIAVHSVVVPGLPVYRPEAHVALAADGSLEVLTLITPPVLLPEMDEEEFAAALSRLGAEVGA